MLKKSILFVALLFGAGLVSTAVAQSYTDGVEYFKAGQADRAKIILDNTLPGLSATDKAAALYYLGEAEFALGNKEVASKCFNEGVNQDAAYAYNYIGLGKLLLGTNDKEAEANFKKAVKFAKTDKAGVNTNVARAYFEAGMPQYKKYLEAANRANPEYAPLYVLQGDIALKNGEVGLAAGEYENAIYYDANCVEAYVKYAKMHYPINPKFAISKLEALLALNQASAIAQREYAEALFNAGRFTQAVKAYATYMSNPNHFATDRARHAALLFFDKKYEESLTLIEEALKDNPEDILLNRFAMYNNNALENFEQAAEYGARYMNEDANADLLTAQDYAIYGNALKKVNRPAEYVALLEKAVAKNPEDATLIKDLSDAYKAADQMVKSADAMAKYMELAGDEVKTMDFFNLGRAYYSAAQADTVMDSKVELFKKADAAFAVVAERAPEDYRGNMWRARCHSGMDPETELGLAKPYYEKVVEMLEARGDKSNSIIEAYQYLGYYNYLKEYAENPQGAKYLETRKWWGKILEINPNHSIKEAMSQL
ncbi:MAG: tetratricopeptide repeat protein [Muribaculaceae bacterium]|nr:tetratricopeptide repeat protein [Muribaculaceae bacterium]